MNAIGSYPVDRAAEAMGYKNTPSFWDRYHEIVDPTMEAINEYHEDKPVEAAGLELGAGVFNPANKVGVGFIKNGTSFANTALRSGVVGSGIGGVAGAMNAERVEDVVPNAFGGSLSGAAIGGALPLATGIAGKMTRPLFTTKKAPITIPTKEQLEAYPAESTFNPNNNYTRADALSALEKRADNLGVELHNNIDEVKEAQLKLINHKNPASNDYLTWIRKKEDIKTFDEALKYPEFTSDYTRQMADDAINSGKIKVYSGYNIKDGTFVTPSKKEALSYSGTDKLDELEVPLQDVAWISPKEGLYAPVTKGKGHFLKKEDRLPFARTLENTVKKPDVKFIQSDGNTIYSKKYSNIPENPFDYVVYDKMGNPYTKYMTNAEYLSDNINAADNISISGRVMDSTNVGYVAPYPKLSNNITLNSVNVKKNTPNLKRIADFLNNYGRRYSPQYLTPYLAQYLANQQ